MPVERVSIPAALAVLATAGVLLFTVGVLLGPGRSAPPAPAASSPAQLARALGRLPLSFERNVGQTDRRARYLARGRDGTLFLTGGGAVLSLGGGEGGRAATVQLRLEGARGDAQIAGSDELPGKVNYLTGKRRLTSVPTYAKVRQRGLLPGVDVLWYGRGGRLEYDFLVAPRADPERIVLRFSGARPRLTENGDLMLRTPGRSVRQLRPVAYQRVGGARRAVPSRYELLGGGRVGLRLGRYDSGRPLVIDPVLLFSTYLGGGGDDRGNGIAVDSAGNAYVTGETTSAAFPSQNPVQEDAGGGADAFVTKFSPSGSVLVYSTYLGGMDGDSGNAIAIDGSGNAT